jgi:hypothetical protein
LKFCVCDVLEKSLLMPLMEEKRERRKEDEMRRRELYINAM